MLPGPVIKFSYSFKQINSIKLCSKGVPVSNEKHYITLVISYIIHTLPFGGNANIKEAGGLINTENIHFAVGLSQRQNVYGNLTSSPYTNSMPFLFSVCEK
jgi:hypothetical protein